MPIIPSKVRGKYVSASEYNKLREYVLSLAPALSHKTRTTHSAIGVTRAAAGRAKPEEAASLQFKGQWNIDTAYDEGDIVIRRLAPEMAHGRQAGTFRAKRDVPAGTAGPIEPAEGAFWETFSKGSFDRLVIREVTSFSPTAATRAGGNLAVGTYYYRITAVVSGVESAPSEEVSEATTAANKTIRISWNTIPNASEYRLYRSGTSNVYAAQSKIGVVAVQTFFDDYGRLAEDGAPPGSGTIDLNSADCLKKEVKVREVTICDNGVEKKMLVVCSEPYA